MIDYKEVLLSLKHERVKLKEQIIRLDTAIKIISNLTSTEQVKTLNSFTALTVRQAVQRCLETNKEGMQTSEITKMLLKGGIRTTAKNFHKTVYNTLFRCNEFTINGKFWTLTKLEISTEPVDKS